MCLTRVGFAQLGQVIVPKSNINGCEPFTEEMFDAEARKSIFHNNVGAELPVILLDRGDCSFVIKVRNVEKVGGSVALIGDTKTENSEIYIMSDDGSGHSVNIPSFFVRKSAGDAFKAAYESGSRIVIKITIETGKLGQTAQVDLWYSTPFDLTLDQLKALETTIPQFGESIKFLLKLRSKPCISCDSFTKENDCLSDGLFCPLMPVNSDRLFKSFIEAIPGRALIKQSLLAKCVHMTIY